MEVPLTGMRWRSGTAPASPTAADLDRADDLRVSTPEADTDRPQLAIAGQIAAARSGNEHALEEVICHYQNRIAAYVVSMVGRNNADLDDLCQVVFVKMALSLPKLSSVNAFEAWLFKIARNVCWDHLRRFRVRSRMVPLTRDHEAIPIEQAPEDSRLDPRVFDAALDRLSADQRRLVDLLREREYSYEELARLTRSSVRAVASRLFRARARLRRLLRHDGAEP